MTTMRKNTGFTLIEVIVAIAITGIVAAIVVVFIQTPVQGYFDAARRAELTDVADGAARRIVRDLRQALPNSVRVTGGNVLEFLSVRDGGRYRGDPGTGTTDILDFTQADSSFDILGPPMTFAAGDWIVIYNLGPSVPDADAYQGATLATHNRRAFAGVTGTPLNKVTISPSVAFPFASPTNRFSVVDTPVTYSCSGGTLVRYWNYAISASQPNPPTGGLNAILAQQNISCSFTYQPGVTSRSGLVAIELSVTLEGEKVTVYHEIHVSNTP